MMRKFAHFTCARFTLVSPVIVHECYRHHRQRGKMVTIAKCRPMIQWFAEHWGYDSRLNVAAPAIAEEWDEEKNPRHLHPNIVSVACVTPCWWICAKCQTNFRMAPEKRTLRGGKCPTCEKAEAEQINTGVANLPARTAKRKQTSKKKKSNKGGPKPRELLRGEANPKLRRALIHPQTPPALLWAQPPSSFVAQRPKPHVSQEWRNKYHNPNDPNQKPL